MEFIHNCSGTCSRSIRFDMDENHIVTGIAYTGGCNGNLQGISKLVEGMNVSEVIERIEGIHCGMKPTSCPDQLARALKEATAK